MNSVQRQIECTTCPWSQNCIEPPMMTADQVEKEMKKEMPVKDGQPPDAGTEIFGHLLKLTIFAGKDREAIVCPVFADKLRQGPELSAAIKKLMKEEKVKEA